MAWCFLKLQFLARACWYHVHAKFYNHNISLVKHLLLTITLKHEKFGP